MQPPSMFISEPGTALPAVHFCGRSCLHTVDAAVSKGSVCRSSVSVGGGSMSTVVALGSADDYRRLTRTMVV
jgi:hypothetical protein